MSTEIKDLLESAEAAHRAGNLPMAEAKAREALGFHQDSAGALEILGVVLAKMGRTDEAKSVLNSLLKVDAKSFTAHLWLSRMARRDGDGPGSLTYAERAHRVHPQDPQGQLNLGQSLLAVHRDLEATEILGKAALQMPDAPPVFHLLGTALQRQHRESEAMDAFSRAISLDPRFVDSRVALGQLLIGAYDFKAAIEQAEAALTVNPNSVAAHHVLVEALIEDKQTERAESHVRKLIEAFPQDSRAHAMWGMRLIHLGKMEEARRSLLRSIELQPVQGFAYCNLALNLKISEADRPLVEKMEALRGHPSINTMGQSHLLYGLGKAYENLGEYERALGAFDEANRLAYQLKFGEREFDRKRYAASVDWTIKTFNRAFLERYRSIGVPDPFPIFVVGMIRSGTTLLEQIVSSHPQVEATGEQRFWPSRWQEAFENGQFAPGKAAELAGQYREILRAYAPDAEHATDKMPGNYAHLGLIHLLFPNARIIHTMRHPVDTCVSIYTTPNSAKNEFAHNRSNIVFGYQQYQRFMEHWRKFLPPDRLLEIRYEDLVNDREPVTRKLVEFCGLEWDDRCLRPQENERSVVTPSVWQVRQPVYASSVERWRRYEPWLGEFRELL